MKRYRILYNPLAGDGTGREAAMHLLDLLPDCELRFYDLTTIGSISSFLAKNDPKDALLLAGGDGTLSRFANEAVTLSSRQEVYYYATGVHNDFWHDIGRQRGDPPVRINRYLDNIRIQIGKHYQSICDRDGYVSADKVKNAYLGTATCGFSTA